jgi:hypothetical protein
MKASTACDPERSEGSQISVSDELREGSRLFALLRVTHNSQKGIYSLPVYLAMIASCTDLGQA